LTSIDQRLREALSQVIYPDFSLDLLSMGVVKEASLQEGLARIILRPIAAPQEKLDLLKSQIEKTLLTLGQVERVSIEWPTANRPPNQPVRIDRVGKTIAVGSCKGGVGKSTLTVNLARCLQAMGKNAGLLDLDIYGPSLPAILNIKQARVNADSEGRIIPLVLPDGLKALSIGFMTAPEQALVWRGPMLIKLVRQLLHKTAWHGLDFLLLDLPPGTGDVQMSLLRHIILDGVIIVSTPQEAALDDTVRGINMFQRSQVPIIGLVENMSYFICPSCQSAHYIFGRDTVEPLARRMNLNFLGQIPLNPALQQLDRQAKDYAEITKPYDELARKLLTV
jgi:ATP-binding protein involved in chromosome partitioning